MLYAIPFGSARIDSTMPAKYGIEWIVVRDNGRRSHGTDVVCMMRGT